jgi:hypothetical protein
MRVETLHDVAVKTEGPTPPQPLPPFPCPTCSARAWQNCEAIRARFPRRSPLDTFGSKTKLHKETGDEPRQGARDHAQDGRAS